MRVLEISKSAAAGYAGALLAALGDPESDPEEAGAPADIAVTRLRYTDSSAQSLGGEVFLHHQKTELGVSKPRSKTASATRLAEFDVVIEDVDSAGLRSLGWSYRSLRVANPALVLVSLSPFGLKGPYASWQGNDFLAQALGGVMHTSGYDGEAPLALPGESAFMIAGLHGATAALTAVFERDSSAQERTSGLHIDISAQDTFMQHWTRHVSEYAYSGVTSRRAQRNPEGLHYRHTAMAKDGWLYLLALREPWQDLAAFLGLGQFLGAEAFTENDNAGPVAQPPWNEIAPAFAAAIAGKSKYTWFSDAAELGWTFAPIEDPFEIAASPQMAARGGMVVARDASGPDAPRDKPLQLPPLPFTQRMT